MEIKSSKPVVRTWLWFVLVLVVGGAIGFCISLTLLKDQPDSNVPIIQPAPVTSSAILPSALPSDTSSPISMTDWKTYTNTKYNYSIKYPSGWVLNQINSEEDIPAIKTSNGITMIYPVNPPFRGYIQIYPTVGVNESAIKDIKQCFDSPTIEQVNINGVSASEISGVANESCMGTGSNIAFYIVKNMIISVASDSSTPSLVMQEIPLILSTFQFTK